MRNEDKLKDLIVMGTKELGEIAECIVKGDKTNHWIDELSDLSALCIKPMLELAGINFENACEIGIRRKRKKMQEAARKGKPNKAEEEPLNPISGCLCCTPALSDTLETETEAELESETLSSLSKTLSTISKIACPYCESWDIEFITFTPDTGIYQCDNCNKKFEL